MAASAIPGLARRAAQQLACHLRGHQHGRMQQGAAGAIALDRKTWSWSWSWTWTWTWTCATFVSYRASPGGIR